VAVDFDNLLDGAGLEEGGGYALFDTEDYALASCDLNMCEYDVGGNEEAGCVRLLLLNRV
jgi:hypothetical protein